MCSAHYQSIRYKNLDGIRRADGRRSHPLYIMWFERKTRGSLCPEWEADFWAFARTVGERPDADHMIYKLRADEPYGPTNWTWALVLRRMEGETKKEFWARKWQSRRANHPDFERRRHLKRNYGVTKEWYEETLAAQGGVCAICEEVDIDRSTGLPRSLSVDHNHATGAIRGLLCFQCNSALGKMREDRRLIHRMADYIDKWEPEAPIF